LDPSAILRFQSDSGSIASPRKGSRGEEICRGWVGWEKKNRGFWMPYGSKPSVNVGYKYIYTYEYIYILYIIYYIYIIIYIYYIPMDPVVPSERKWDWGMIFYNLRRLSRTFSDSGHGSIGMVLVYLKNERNSHRFDGSSYFCPTI